MRQASSRVEVSGTTVLSLGQELFPDGAAGDVEEGGIRGNEAVSGEAGGLPLDLGTASRSAAPVASVFPCDRAKP